MDFETLRQRIGSRAVIVDENMSYSNLRAFLNTNHIPWRQFRKGITDEEIARHMLANEVVITADRRFAYNLQDRAILIPLTKSHLHQIQHLDSKFSRKNGSPWARLDTCPLCAAPDLNTQELTFWDEDHVMRHRMNPVVTVSRNR